MRRRLEYTGPCMEEIYFANGGKGKLKCTAKEVFFAPGLDIDVTVIDGCDSATDYATVDVVASIKFNSDRYDIGIYSALDGGDALTRLCALDILNATLKQNLTDDDGMPNGGKTGDGDLDTPGDVCSDVLWLGGILQIFRFQSLTLPCDDMNDNGFLDYSTCFSWKVGGGNDECANEAEAYPSPKSKCNCEETFRSPSHSQVRLLQNPRLNVP
jgi:hypothetical protein